MTTDLHVYADAIERMAGDVGTARALAQLKVACEKFKRSILADKALSDALSGGARDAELFELEHHARICRSEALEEALSHG